MTAIDTPTPITGAGKSAPDWDTFIALLEQDRPGYPPVNARYVSRPRHRRMPGRHRMLNRRLFGLLTVCVSAIANIAVSAVISAVTATLAPLAGAALVSAIAVLAAVVWHDRGSHPSTGALAVPITEVDRA